MKDLVLISLTILTENNTWFFLDEVSGQNFIVIAKSDFYTIDSEVLFRYNT